VTDRQTDAAWSVTISRIYERSTAMRPNNKLMITHAAYNMVSLHCVASWCSGNDDGHMNEVGPG